MNQKIFCHSHIKNETKGLLNNFEFEIIYSPYIPLGKFFIVNSLVVSPQEFREKLRKKGKYEETI